MVCLLSMQALLEVNGHIADLRREAGKVASEEQGDVLEILPVQLLFGKYQVIIVTGKGSPRRPANIMSTITYWTSLILCRGAVSSLSDPQ